MEFVKKEKKGKVIEITVKEKRFGFLKKTTKYSSDHVIVDNYRRWLKEPSKIIADGIISIKLDEWCKNN